MITAKVYQLANGLHIIFDKPPQYGATHVCTACIDFFEGKYEVKVYKTEGPSGEILGEYIALDEDELQVILKPYHIEFAKPTYERLMNQRTGKATIEDETMIGNGAYKAVVMKCGHINQGVTDMGEPICVICNCTEETDQEVL